MYHFLFFLFPPTSLNGGLLPKPKQIYWHLRNRLAKGLFDLCQQIAMGTTFGVPLNALPNLQSLDLFIPSIGMRVALRLIRLDLWGHIGVANSERMVSVFSIHSPRSPHSPPRRFHGEPRGDNVRGESSPPRLPCVVNLNRVK